MTVARGYNFNVKTRKERMIKMAISFAQWLKTNRLKRGMSREELAKQSGYSSQQIYNLERGIREFNIHHLQLFSEIFETTVSLQVDKGAIKMTSTPVKETNLTNLTTVPSSHEERLDNLGEELLNSIQYAIQSASENEQYESAEQKINALMEELWDEDLPTEAFAQAKCDLVEHFIGTDESLINFANMRERYVSEALKRADELSEKHDFALEIISLFQIDTNEESLYGVSTQLEGFYSEVKKALDNNPNIV